LKVRWFVEAIKCRGTDRSSCSSRDREWLSAARSYRHRPTLFFIKIPRSRGQEVKCQGHSVT